jgi:hypothetical protein
VENNTAPRISVVVAVFNGQNTLQQCIDSIVGQRYAHIEIIVIDGGSTDATASILKTNDSLITYWVSEPDRGIYHAWNKALQKATGDWICFLGADDFFWAPSVLATMAGQLIQAPPDVQLVHGQVMLLSAAGEPLYPIGQAWPDVGKQLRKMMCIPHPGAMHRRSFFDRHGVFDETFRIAGDYEMLLRGFADDGAQAFFIQNLVTVGMRHGGVSSNPANSLAAMQETRKAQKKHSNSLPDSVWIWGVMRIYVRLLVWKLVGESTGKRILDLARRMKGLPPYWTKV